MRAFLLSIFLLLTALNTSAQHDEYLPSWTPKDFTIVHQDSLQIDDVVKDLQGMGFIMFYTDRNYFMATKKNENWEVWQITDVPGAPYDSYDADFSSFETKQVNGSGKKEVIFHLYEDNGGTSGDFNNSSVSCWNIESKTMLFNIQYSEEERTWWTREDRDEFEYINEKGDTLIAEEWRDEGYNWEFDVLIEDQRLVLSDLKYSFEHDETRGKDYQLIEIDISHKNPPTELLEELSLGTYLYKNGRFIRQKHIDR
jgi:hypothetical protein